MSARSSLGGGGAGKPAASHLSGVTVLVAEDQETLRDIYQVLLERCGVRKVQFAVNGLDAWHQLNLMPFDILITDLYMPELDGRGLIERIKVSQKPAIRQMPIILITGDEKYRGCTSISDHPLVAALNKPFLPAALRTALEQALAYSRDLSARPGAGKSIQTSASEAHG